MEMIYLVASGDLRLSANQNCEAAQAEMERQLVAAIEGEGYRVKRAHPYDPAKKHGFIDSQKYGLEVFSKIPKDAPVIVAEAVWQYTHHVLPGLLEHRGPVLTVANWSGTWPGLVGMLNLNGSLAKAGRKYSTLWSEGFTDEFFLSGLRSWLKKAPSSTIYRTFIPTIRLLRPQRLPASAPNTPRISGRSEPSWAFLMKAAWACTMPLSPMSCSSRWASTRSA